MKALTYFILIFTALLTGQSLAASCSSYSSCSEVVQNLGGNWGLTDRDGDSIPCEKLCKSRDEVLTLLDKYGRKEHTGKLYEIDYAKVLCHKLNGQIEYHLPDRTRVDCLTDTQAIEVDFIHKIDECITQAAHYGEMTGRTPVCALLVTNNEDLSAIGGLPESPIEIMKVLAGRECTLSYMAKHSL